MSFSLETSHVSELEVSLRVPMRYAITLPVLENGEETGVIIYVCCSSFDFMRQATQSKVKQVAAHLSKLHTLEDASRILQSKAGQTKTKRKSESSRQNLAKARFKRKALGRGLASLIAEVTESETRWKAIYGGSYTCPDGHAHIAPGQRATLDEYPCDRCGALLTPDR